MGKHWHNGRPITDAAAPITSPVTPLPSAPARKSSRPLGVVVTCHEAYLPLLPACLEAIDAQSNLGPRVLVLDRCDITAPAGWHVIKGDWGTPNPARNEGTRACSAEWLIFWDADDVMPPGYLAAQAANIDAGPLNLAISYPIICRGHAHPHGSYIQSQRQPWNYWSQRDKTVIATPAAWRRAAIETVGGWPEENECADDHCLALRITALGWTARLLDTPILECSRHHLGHRSSADHDALLRSLWPTRTLTIITLMLGRADAFEDWLLWLQCADLPPRTSLVIVDNAADNHFTDRLMRAINTLTWRFESISIRRHRTGKLPAALPRNHIRRSREVAEDYNRTLASINSDLILTLEDDMLPPDNAVRLLAEHIRPHGTVAAAGACYESARHPGFLAASLDKRTWRAPALEDAPRNPMEAGWLPGGCTLFSNAALRASLPLVTRATDTGESAWNWDNDFSHKLRALGYRLILDGRVWAEHQF